MPGMTRRRLLGSAAATAAGTAAALLPPNVRRAVAAGSRRGSLSDVEHVVLLMQENRSFDHYFGTLAGVRGFGDPDAVRLRDGRDVFHQPDPVNPDGYLLPFHLDTHRTSAQAIPSTSHAWDVQHESWNYGRMDRWVRAHRAADGAKGPFTMGYYTRDDIPFHYALAESFTVCDNYFCSVMGPTWPNRLYWMSGTIDPGGRRGGPVITNAAPTPYRWTTYPERLQEAGVSWQVYQEEDNYGCNMLVSFEKFRRARRRDPLHQRGLTASPAGTFEDDARNNRLPTVSWIIPTSYQCEHPDYLPAAGADYIASKIEAIAANPEVWAKTVFILVYDENDGLFDHVPPPVPRPGTPGEVVGGLPIGAGFRVPCIIVSPWTVGGWVAREPFDHTSQLQFLERITGVRETNITAWRRAAFGDLTSAFQFADGPRRPPRLPDTEVYLEAAEVGVENLPRPTFPDGHQHPPRQERGPLRRMPPWPL
ncbi:alkaline phosphatase family protein [Peterkaempfera bronchialis]|uniref:phospholipase C n=1 Tax=Peterkaempfera bronchialis TaxID=2126346 RepID=A0A345T1T6_9ACTN|nr:alkaline phosphatase family protein [Peterkaempfera bronchialis]AXI79941.1 phospholipase [Peterkaempfera bronchialis]